VFIILVLFSTKLIFFVKFVAILIKRGKSEKMLEDEHIKNTAQLKYLRMP
jgi:hypothetical protein